MKKIVKRLLLVLAILLVLVIAAAIIIPIVFKPQLMELAKTEINKSVKAKVEFTDFQVSLFKGFPDLYIGLKGLKVTGVDAFEGETLVAFDEFSVKVDLMSVFGMKNIQIKSILLDNPVMNARINELGQANWDIAYPSEVVEEEVVDTTATDLSMRVALKKFQIINAQLAYTDDSSKMGATIKGLNFFLAGDMGLDYTELEVKTGIDALSFTMDGMRYVKDAKLGFNAKVGADLANGVYTLNNNEFTLNDILLAFSGVIKMPKDDIDIDLTFATGKTDFKSLLSMVPAIYMTDFKELQTAGKLKLDGYVKGVVSETTLPNVGLDLVVENAMFRYPALPKSVDNINIDTKVLFDGTNQDNTTVDVNRFALNLGGNPFAAEVHVKTPMSDMEVNGFVNGKIDFNTLADVVPMDSITLKGILDANLKFGGRLSYIESEQYEKFLADGKLALAGFVFNSPDLPKELQISETQLVFSPKFVELSTFKASMGKTDFSMAGRLENFIPFALSDGILRGNLTLASNLIDANEIMSGLPTDTTTVVEEDTTAMSLIEVPKNIDFNLKVDLKKVYYDKLDIANIAGKVRVAEGRVIMDKLGMELLQGSMVMTGEYSTADIKEPKAAFNLDITDFDIPTTFRSFSSIEKMAPAAKNLSGKISTKFDLTTLIDTTMSPVLNSINAQGRFQSKTIAINDSPTFGKIADALKNDKLRNPSLKDVNTTFSIRDGRIYIDPFDTDIAGIKTNFGGDMGMDQTLNYDVKMAVPTAMLGKGADLISGLAALASSKGIKVEEPKQINVKLKVVGTVTKPEVKMDFGDSKQSAKESTKEVVKEQAKDEAKKKASEQAQKLIADAEVEAEKVRAEAAVLADKIRKEAEANATKLENEAKNQNPLAKAAAKKAAEKLRKEGEASAQKVIKEADVKAQAIIDKAKAEAAKLE